MELMHNYIKALHKRKENLRKERRKKQNLEIGCRSKSNLKRKYAIGALHKESNRISPLTLRLEALTPLGYTLQCLPLVA
jgi:hypothetical protein